MRSHLFVLFGLTFAVWRAAHAEIVDEVVAMLRRVLGSADLSHKQAAAACDVDPAQWHRQFYAGANLAQLVILARTFPEFGAALHARLGALLSPGDPTVARVNAVTMKAITCDEQRHDSSEASPWPGSAPWERRTQ